MKILWTFDPFEKNKQLRFFGKKLLLNLFDKSDKVKAVYMASRSEINLTTAFDVPKKNRFTIYPKKLIKSELKKLNLMKIDVVVIPELSMSTTASVKKLASFAKESKTDLIVISTHGKVGLPRFILGSFAESLVHSAQTNVLLYNQKTKLSKTPKKLVYAHDFSRKGADGLPQVLDYANKWNASLVIVHVPESNYSFSFQGPDEDAESYRKYVNDVAIQIEQTVRRRGIPCEIFIEPSWKKSASQSILDTVKKVNADIAIVTAKSGKMAALLGGGVTRNIIRESRVPTLILKV